MCVRRGLGATGKPPKLEKRLCKSIRTSACGLRTPTLPQGKGTPSLAGQSPLAKQSAGLFCNSPRAERARQGNFADCGQRRGLCPRPASLFYEKRLGEKPVLSLAGLKSLSRPTNSDLSRNNFANLMQKKGKLRKFGTFLYFCHNIFSWVMR